VHALDPQFTADGEVVRLAGSSATPRGTSYNDGRKYKLTYDIHADLTPFPCCWCPPRGSNLRRLRVPSPSASASSKLNIHVGMGVRVPSDSAPMLST